MNGGWSEKTSSGMTDEKLIEYVKTTIREAKAHEKAAYDRNDPKAAEYWIGKTVAASQILMHLEARK